MSFENKARVILKSLKVVVLAYALYYLAAYLYIALSRMSYPFELEWMEGGSVDHVKRVLEGKPLYVYPSLNFIPYIYTPFYYYVAAIFSKIVGLGFFPLRLVSFFSSMGIFTLIYHIVMRETRKREYAFISMGLFAATFRLGGAWLDIARVDSLFLFLILLGFYLLLFYKNNISLLACVSCFYLSFLTKQTSVTIFALPLFVAVIDQGRRGFVMAALTSLLILSTVFFWNKFSQGWFLYYIYYLPKLHDWDPRFLWGFWRDDMCGHIPVLLFISLGLIFFDLKNASMKRLYYSSFLFGCLGSSWLSRMHIGGYDNVLLVIFLAASISAGLSLFWAEENEFLKKMSFHRLISGLFVVALIIQFMMLYYPVRGQIPTKDDRRFGELFLEKIRNFSEKDIYIPSHPYYSIMAGKKTSGAHIMAMLDVLRAKDHNVKIFLMNSIKNEILEGSKDIIILDWEGSIANIDQRYVLQEKLFIEGSTFVPVTGCDFRPHYIFVKKLE